MNKKDFVYYSFKDYLINNYGNPFYRIPIDLALSCPHKNKKGEGCIFCAEDGARAVHLSKHLNLKKQVEDGIKYVENRYNANGNYIAYFQSYTNTNADAETLKKLYEEVLSYAGFKIVIISTRPDCLSCDILKLLENLNSKYDLWIELGVQTAKDETLKRINRGHSFSEVKKAVLCLNELKIKTVAHIIFGLPDENFSDYINTVNELNKLPFAAYKFHNLLLLKNSPMASAYNKADLSGKTGEFYIPEIGNINLMNEFEYAGILIELIRRIPQNRPLLRVTADAVESNIIGPKWNLSKGQFLELIKSTMKENGFCQGELFELKINNEKLKIAKKSSDNQHLSIAASGKDQLSTINQQLSANNYQPISNNQSQTTDNLTSPLSYLKVKTEDNSFTFYSPKYKENYHSLAGAESEALKKFVIPSKLTEKLIEKKEVKLLDIGFGLGYNAISAIKKSISLNTMLSIVSLEMDKNTLNMGLCLFDSKSLEHEILRYLISESFWSDNKNSIRLFAGDDARNSVKNAANSEFDIIFLDAFSTQKNPELWTYDFIKVLAGKLNVKGCIVTYSSAFPVRGAFVKCGLYVGETEPFGRIKGGTIASNDCSIIEQPISEKDLNIILKSTAGVPYRDFNLKWNAKQILDHKENLSRKLRKKGIPKWFKQQHYK